MIRSNKQHYLLLQRLFLSSQRPFLSSQRKLGSSTKKTPPLDSSFRWNDILCYLLLILFLLPNAALAFSTTPKPIYQTSTVTVTRADATTLTLTIDIAANEAARRQGLMFRESLPEDGGMLFIFPTAHNVNMWMKNTYIPLDMLFIAEDGTIVSIAENTTPHSLTRITAGQEVKAVLELNAGAAQRLRIHTGDHLAWKTP